MTIDPIETRGGPVLGGERVLTRDALEFVAGLTRRFGGERETLLARRHERQRRFDAGELPAFLPETASVRSGDWVVAPAPADLDDRRVEITGPTDAKMMINALNSRARIFMADFEDALSPPWANVVGGQVNCREAVRRSLEYTSPDGKQYRLGKTGATLVVRPRGWHLEEVHLRVDGKPVPASLFDFGLYFYHNARELLSRGSGPYFYLPKLESHLEARLWNSVFDAAQDALGLPRGTIRATILIETIVAAFEMDEILYELRPHAAGLNAGRWDYIFSVIKKFGRRPEFVLPDRAQITMAVPFMQAYTELMVQTCHRRGAHAIGGMAAFIPSRRDRGSESSGAGPRAGRQAARGRARLRWGLGCPPRSRASCGSGIQRGAGHPAQPEGPGTRGGGGCRAAARRPDSGRPGDGGRRARQRECGTPVPRGLARGSGAVAINNMMEDTATAEIARAQLWQWVHHGTVTDSGRQVTLEGVRSMLAEELAAMRATRRRRGVGMRLRSYSTPS